jgi:hypothetical protein
VLSWSPGLRLAATGHTRGRMTPRTGAGIGVDTCIFNILGKSQPFRLDKKKEMRTDNGRVDRYLISTLVWPKILKMPGGELAL